MKRRLLATRASSMAPAPTRVLYLTRKCVYLPVSKTNKPFVLPAKTKKEMFDSRQQADWRTAPIRQRSPQKTTSVYAYNRE